MMFDTWLCGVTSQNCRFQKCIYIYVSLLFFNFAPFRRRRDVSGVVPQGLAGEAGLEDLDGVEDEAGPDLCEGAVLLDDLEVAEPDAVVGHAEGEHVVEEGLAPRVVVRHPEYLRYIADCT